MNHISIDVLGVCISASFSNYACQQFAIVSLMSALIMFFTVVTVLAYEYREDRLHDKDSPLGDRDGVGS